MSKFSGPLFYSRKKRKESISPMPLAHDAEQLYQDFLNRIEAKDSPPALLGIYDVINDKMYLHPVIKNFVWIEIDKNTGEYTNGWRVERIRAFGKTKFLKGEKIPNEELQKYHSTGYIPRKYSYKGKRKDYTSHRRLIEISFNLENIKEFVGFTILQNRIAWNSTTLNRSHDHRVPDEIQKKITDQLENWRQRRNLSPRP